MAALLAEPPPPPPPPPPTNPLPSFMLPAGPPRERRRRRPAVRARRTGGAALRRGRCFTHSLTHPTRPDQGPPAPLRLSGPASALARPASAHPSRPGPAQPGLQLKTSPSPLRSTMELAQPPHPPPQRPHCTCATRGLLGKMAPARRAEGKDGGRRREGTPFALHLPSPPSAVRAHAPLPPSLPPSWPRPHRLPRLGLLRSETDGHDSGPSRDGTVTINTV